MDEQLQGPDPARMTAGEAYMNGNADAFSESAAYLYGAASSSDGTARVALWRAAEVMQQRERDCRTAMRSRAEDGPEGPQQDRPRRLPVLPGDRDEAPRSPEGPDEGLRERLVDALARYGNLAPEMTRERHPKVWAEIDDLADAVLPLLTAERERVDALQRQVNQVRALCDKAKQQQPGRLPAVDVRDLDAALSRTATEETQ